MKRLITILLLAMLVSLRAGTVAFAEGDPIKGCPDTFTLHPAMEHDGEHEHQHVGTDTDRNADGWICVKHVSVDTEIHVHTDNNVPLH